MKTRGTNKNKAAGRSGKERVDKNWSFVTSIVKIEPVFL